MNTSPQTRTQLREFLDDRGIRYIWVAEKLGVTPGHMSRLLDGTRPVTTDNAAKLAELFNVPAASFLPATAPMACHCGRPAHSNGNGLADTCNECLALWLAAGEPELCPCAALPGVH